MEVGVGVGARVGLHVCYSENWSNQVSSFIMRETLLISDSQAAFQQVDIL